MRESILLDNVYVSRRDTAAGINVITEVGACHRLEGLRFTEIGVATGHYSAGVYIPKQYTR